MLILSFHGDSLLMLILFWVIAPCRSWLVANISEDYTACIISTEVRNVRKYPVYIGIGDGASYGKWPSQPGIRRGEIEPCPGL
jgi:hypothetical protein